MRSVTTPSTTLSVRNNLNLVGPCKAYQLKLKIKKLDFYVDLFSETF